MNKPTKILLAAIGALLLGAMAVSLLRPAIERKIERSIFVKYALSPEEIDAYYRWRNEPIVWPEEALRAEPYPAELTSDVHAMYRLWRGADYDAIWRFESTYSLSDPPSLEAIEPYRDLLERFATIAGHPDYDLAVFELGMVDLDDPGLPVEPGVDFNFVQWASTLLTLRSAARVSAGDEPGALDDMRAVAMASRAGVYEMEWTHTLAIEMRTIATRGWRSLVRASGDPQVIREALAAQNEMATSSIHRPPVGDTMALDMMGGLRSFMRRGFDVDAQGLSGLELVEEYDEVRTRYYREAIGPFVERHPGIAAKVDGLRGRYSSVPIGRLPAAYFYVVNMPNPLMVGMMANRASVRFDLALIETASKLFEIERGRAAAGMEDLVPEYLPAIPADPFAGVSVGYRRADGRYYSIGPDGVDDGGAVTYDPTNGAASAGDIFLPPEG